MNSERKFNITATITGTTDEVLQDVGQGNRSAGIERLAAAYRVRTNPVEKKEVAPHVFRAVAILPDAYEMEDLDWNDAHPPVENDPD